MGKVSIETEELWTVTNSIYGDQLDGPDGIPLVDYVNNFVCDTQKKLDNALGAIFRVKSWKVEYTYNRTYGESVIDPVTGDSSFVPSGDPEVVTEDFNVSSNVSNEEQRNSAIFSGFENGTNGILSTSILYDNFEKAFRFEFYLFANFPVTSTYGDATINSDGPRQDAEGTDVPDIVNFLRDDPWTLNLLNQGLFIPSPDPTSSAMVQFELTNVTITPATYWSYGGTYDETTGTLI